MRRPRRVFVQALVLGDLVLDSEGIRGGRQEAVLREERAPRDALRVRLVALSATSAELRDPHIARVHELKPIEGGVRHAVHDVVGELVDAGQRQPVEVGVRVLVLLACGRRSRAAEERGSPSRRRHRDSRRGTSCTGSRPCCRTGADSRDPDRSSRRPASRCGRSCTTVPWPRPRGSRTRRCKPTARGDSRCSPRASSPS
jgi:hypothetical protein